MSRPIAVITGASGGIGRACVEEFAVDHDVAIHYHSNRDGAEAAADAATKAGADTAVLSADIADRSEADGLIDDVVDRFGGIDVLVNNAAIFHRSDILDATPDEISSTLSVNLEGTIYCTRAALPTILDGGGGHVVSISSTAGVRGSPTDPVYGASKAGVLGFVRSIARQFTDQGVFSNAVAPGPTDTPMFDEDRRPAKRESSPIGRLVKPAEVADTVRFFAETECISGRVLVVDGGDN